jgi:DNA invertase Pin-like site-specific DNA recombinase
MIQQVTAHHLTRLACLYVRQSTLQQVLENTESTARQYALRERARALGWADERIVVIDQDLGHSRASTVDRLGFQRLVADVGLGQVGLVLGLEVSRLARNSSDWHHLLEICALTHTLILDEEGLYDPSTFNDRLLLGLKGTMSEAELFVLRARLQGGILNKARRGALKLVLPMGLCYTESDTIVLDPNGAAYKPPFGKSFSALSRPDRPLRPFVTFTGNICSFRGGFAVGRIKEKLCGERSSIMMFCGFCTIQPMQEPTSLGAHVPQKPLMERFIVSMFLVPNGLPL